MNVANNEQLLGVLLLLFALTSTCLYVFGRLLSFCGKIYNMQNRLNAAESRMDNIVFEQSKTYEELCEKYYVLQSELIDVKRECLDCNAYEYDNSRLFLDESKDRRDGRDNFSRENTPSKSDDSD